jgi:hypothetical protein
MWEHVRARKHVPEKVFVGALSADIEFMIHGSLRLEMKDGSESKVTWAGRAVLKEVQGRLRFKCYQVYLHRYIPRTMAI